MSTPFVPPKKHVSATQRFTDSGFRQVEWSPELVFRLLRIDAAWSRARKLRLVQEAVNDGDLPDEAVEAMIASGYGELA